MPEYVFDALDAIEKRIRQVRAEIGYITLCEVVDRNHADALGRVDFDSPSLAPWLHEIDEDGLAPPDLDDLESATTPAEDANLRLAEAACRWLREMALNNMHGRPSCRFRVFVWRPKGNQIIFSPRFGCTDLSFDADSDAPGPAVVLPPTVTAGPPAAGVEALPEARAWNALGGGYTHLIELLQKSYAHLATLQNTTINNQNTQILRLQKVLEELLGEVTSMRVGQAEVDTARRSDDRDGRVREELGRQFISELGTFGRALAASKLGMSPEIVELAEVVNGSPELMNALRQPEVRSMLRDEKTRLELAELLLAAARSTTPPPPPPAAQAA